MVAPRNNFKVIRNPFVKLDLDPFGSVHRFDDLNIRHLAIIVGIIARKSIAWKRITQDEVGRYLNLLKTVREFCTSHDLDGSVFDALDLSLTELREFSNEEASDLFENSLLELTAEVLGILKQISKQNGFWFEIILQSPRKITIYHSVNWSKGFPKIDKRKCGVHDGISAYYEDALCTVMDVYDRVLNKQKQ